jgi:sulfite exporter TauE/SafE
LMQINLAFRLRPHKPMVFDFLTPIADWCGTPIAAHGGVAAGMLLAGLTASPLHCAPMCGGFVLGQVSDRMARLPGARLHECHRFSTALLSPYHVGRLTTYALLGLASGAGGLLINRFTGSAGVFLLLGAVLLLAQAARRLGPAFTLPFTRSLRGYPLGIALGFLPCGVLYAALAAAAATASPLTGALAMLSFGLGTIPALVVVGLFGAAAGHRLRRSFAALAPAVLVFNAGLLTVLGVKMLVGS